PQVLAAPPRGGELAAAQRVLEVPGAGRVAPDRARVQDPDLVDLPPGYVLREPAADGLDLWELGHGLAAGDRLPSGFLPVCRRGIGGAAEPRADRGPGGLGRLLLGFLLRPALALAIGLG